MPKKIYLFVSAVLLVLSAFFGVKFIMADFLGYGTFSSTNLLSGFGVSTINAFGYDCAIPSGATIQIQFSQDSSNWYNSAGIQNSWDTLADGNHLSQASAIDLSFFDWKTPFFYYRARFTNTDPLQSPSLNNVRLYYVPGATALLSVKSFTNVTFNSLTANATILAITGGNATRRGFQYGTTTDPVWDVHEDGDFPTGNYSLDISGLDLYQTYYFRAYTVNPISTAYSDWAPFVISGYNSYGVFSSANLLSSIGTSTIYSFGYDCPIPANTTLKVQFSKNNTSWYNSAGVLNGWDTLAGGNHLSQASAVDLSPLGWRSPSFYYQAKFTSADPVQTPLLKEVKVFYAKGPVITSLTPPSNTSDNYCKSWLDAGMPPQKQTGRNGSFGFTWLYQDPGGSPLKSYQLKVSETNDVVNGITTTYQNPTDLSIDSGSQVDSGTISVKISPEPGELSYNKTYYWWVNTCNAGGACTNWIAGPSFSTPQKHYPIVGMTRASEKIIANEDTQFCTTADIHDPTDPCYSACYKGSASPAVPDDPNRIGTDWVCSACFDSSNNYQACQDVSGTAYNWYFPGDEGTDYVFVSSTNATSPNPVVRFLKTGKGTKIKLNVSGSSCGDEVISDILLPSPVWREKNPF